MDPEVGVAQSATIPIVTRSIMADQVTIGNAPLFEDKRIRHNFIKKVYSLLTIQLIITVAIVGLFAVHQPIHDWALKNHWVAGVAIVFSIVILLVVACSRTLVRKHPWNLILLFAFTLGQSALLVAVTVSFNTKVVAMAGGITALICFTLTIFAFQTRWDFTTKGGIMLVILLVATLALVVGAFFPPSRSFQLVMASVMAIIMGIYLVIDTQMIVGGTHKVQLSPEEYVFAAINLYLDIINMFLQILTISGRD